jgi:hypothetical protein
VVPQHRHERLQLKNGSTAITAATAKTATVRHRFLTFVAAQKTIAAGGNFTVFVPHSRRLIRRHSSLRGFHT